MKEDKNGAGFSQAARKGGLGNGKAKIKHCRRWSAKRDRILPVNGGD